MQASLIPRLLPNRLLTKVRSKYGCPLELGFRFTSDPTLVVVCGRGRNDRGQLGDGTNEDRFLAAVDLGAKDARPL